MPFAAWSYAATTLNWWRLLLLCLGILAFRRLPAMYALWHWIPDIKTRREAIFSGHFGPMGVGAIFISTLAATKLPTPTLPPETAIDRLALMIVPVTYCIVLSSILVHGLTISFFTLGRKMHSRVQSFSRTLTANSSRSGFGRTFSLGTFGTTTRKADDREEPSWMARVKRATRAEDIIINRDDAEEDSAPSPGRSDESPESLAEKGRVPRDLEPEAEEEEELEEHAREEVQAEGKEPTPSEIEAEIDDEVDKDEGATAMFGAPADDKKVGAGQKEQLMQQRREAKREKRGLTGSRSPTPSRHRGRGTGSRSRSRPRTPEEEPEEAEVPFEDAPGDREADVAEAGGADVEKEVETEDDIRRGEIRAARHRQDLAADREREEDDHPPKNILGHIGEDENDTEEAKQRYREKQRHRRESGRHETQRHADRRHTEEREAEEEQRERKRPPAERQESSRRSRTPSPMGKSDHRKEARYCRGTKTWQEGRKVRFVLSVQVLQIPAALESALILLNRSSWITEMAMSMSSIRTPQRSRRGERRRRRARKCSTYLRTQSRRNGRHSGRSRGRATMRRARSSVPLPR